MKVDRDSEFDLWFVDHVVKCRGVELSPREHMRAAFFFALTLNPRTAKEIEQDKAIALWEDFYASH